MKPRTLHALPMVYLVLVAAALAKPGHGTEMIRLTLVTDEAEAALALLEKPRMEAEEGDWQRLFTSEGYQRLRKREDAMGRSFSDADFREFLRDPEVRKRAPELRRVLEEWSAADLVAHGRRALVYLPPDTPIGARVYLLIKPQTNTFVFEAATDPAIMFYLDPSVSADKFVNTAIHELHHIGLTTACRDRPQSEQLAEQDEALRIARRWAGAFGEGLAMLAAAGSPEVHPHAVSVAADRERWDRDVARSTQHRREIEGFFQSVLDGTLEGDAVREKAMSFYGVQGPWYTVGWQMAAKIERSKGRAALVESMCNPVELMRMYNSAVEGDERWSGELLDRLEAVAPLP